MNSFWNRDEGLVPFVLFTGNSNRFLIRPWFTKLSWDRTNPICVFPHYFASGRSETQENVLLLWKCPAVLPEKSYFF